MTLLSGEVRNLTLQHMQGKCAYKFSSLTKAPYKLLGVGRSKRRQTLNICLGEEPLTNLSDLRESFKEQNLSLCFKNHTKTQVSEHE